MRARRNDAGGGGLSLSPAALNCSRKCTSRIVLPGGEGRTGRGGEARRKVRPGARASQGQGRAGRRARAYPISEASRPGAAGHAPARGESEAMMACTRRRSMVAVLRSRDACRSASGTRPGVLRMKRTEAALPVWEAVGSTAGRSGFRPGAWWPCGSIPWQGASVLCAVRCAARFWAALCSAVPSPANHSTSPASSTSCGDTAWMVCDPRSMVDRKALGSCAGQGGRARSAAGPSGAAAAGRMERGGSGHGMARSAGTPSSSGGGSTRAPGAGRSAARSCRPAPW